jgi:hypothetical protein
MAKQTKRMTSATRYMSAALLSCAVARAAGQIATASETVYPAKPEVVFDGTAVLVEDYASLPISTARKEADPYPPPTNFNVQLGRPTSMRSEPSGAPMAGKRFFVMDQNGILYTLDKTTRKFTPYIDIGKLYSRFISDPPFGMGFISLVFDPNYARNGKFYTVHSEKVSMPGGRAPNAGAIPGLDLTKFKGVDPANPPAGTALFECVLMEWTDTSINDDKFIGTARELMRIGYNFTIHPMGEAIFNPLAKPGTPDYGNLYIGLGDGATGEQPGPTHNFPQRLDWYVGKILRITPDVNLRPKDILSGNGAYRVPSTGPDPNPFVTIKTALPEIYAYGFRNPHRLTWDAQSNTLFAADIGLHLWEETNIVKKGGNYGWAEREGPEQVFITGPHPTRTGSTVDPEIPFPVEDKLTVEGLAEPVTPIYPATVYSHLDGAAVGPGFVYHGKLLPQLRGKYIYTEIATGLLYYSDFDRMLAVKGIRGKSAPIYKIKIIYKAPGASAPQQRRMYDIVTDGYKEKGGKAPANTVLPGHIVFTGKSQGPNSVPPLADSEGIPYGNGRADVRLALGGDGELYMLCKSDGWVRRIAAVKTPPPIHR